jgi:hypothetical protein
LLVFLDAFKADEGQYGTEASWFETRGMLLTMRVEEDLRPRPEEPAAGGVSKDEATASDGRPHH